MAAKIAAIKAKMGGGAAPAAPAAAAPAAPAAAPGAGAAPSGDVAAKIAALKNKMEAGKPSAAPAAPARKPSAAKTAPASKAGATAVFPVQPIDRTSFGGERLYGKSTLNRWFTVCSAALVFTVIWMMIHDYQRDWKGIQTEAREIKMEQAREQLENAQAAIDADALADLQGRLESAQEKVAAQQDTLDRLTAEQLQLEGEFYGLDQNFKFAKSEYDAGRYKFEENRLLRGDDPDLLASSEETLAGMLADMTAKQALADAKNLELSAKKAEVNAITAEASELEKQITAMTKERDSVASRLSKLAGVSAETILEDPTATGLFADHIRNAPIADMLAPSLKIDQIVLEKLKDNYNFMYVGKIDRCTTCHVNMQDRSFGGPEWDEQGKRVFASHPRLDLFVADTSPHPMGEFGCTVCHQGRGQAVEFPRTFHVPTADEEETAAEKEARWTADYGYDSHRHYWDWPMVPQDKIYSSCFQCHQDTDRIDGVPEYNESRQLVEELGCYGCHKIEGFEHLRKAGPDLHHIAAKTTEPWARKWIEEPRDFRPTTRMPHFFNQSNTGKEMEGWNNNSDRWVADWRARNDVEVRAITSYIFDLSEKALAGGSYDPRPLPAKAGDPEAGGELFASRGCLGCHSQESAGFVAEYHGPDLSSMGSKVNARWLYNWLLEPHAYFPGTVMPDLRLTDAEAIDITAYLLSGRDEAWEKAPGPLADDAILDSIAIEYLAPLSSDALARSQVADWRANGGSDRVELYVGEKLFARYGCSGCHSAPGHELDKGVGTELTKEGLKQVSKFDFAFEYSPHNPERIPHTRHDWIALKLKDPRIFDRMPVIEETADGPVIVRNDMKVKAPGEKLKMPNFGLDEREIKLITQFVMGLREDGIDESMKRSLSGEEQVLEQADRLITERNCMGCHKIGQLARPLDLAEFDDEETYRKNYWMAHPLVADGETILADEAWVDEFAYSPFDEEELELIEIFEEHPPEEPIMVYGKGEGGMGTYIDEPAMRPPVLRREGAKVNPDWLFEFLLNPYIVRTHVEVRMPSFNFTPEQSMALTRWFAAKAGEPWPFGVDDDAEFDPELFAKGAERFEVLQCNSCHPAGGVDPSNPDKSNWGPDLALSAERLKGEWVHDWLKEPQLIQPRTKMPNFFGTWDFDENEYAPDVDDWEDAIREIRHYVRHLERAMDGGPVSKGE
jgi:cbb3-type cytochrome oxidase cytochrome c subunit/predicted  nucleic acid-binding Zn-ribbon protein